MGRGVARAFVGVLTMVALIAGTGFSASPAMSAGAGVRAAGLNVEPVDLTVADVTDAYTAFSDGTVYKRGTRTDVKVTGLPEERQVTCLDSFPSSDTAFVAFDDGSTYRINGTSAAQVTGLPAGKRGTHLAAVDATHAYITLSSGSIYQLTGTASALVVQLANGISVTLLDAAPSGSTAYAALSDGSLKWLNGTSSTAVAGLPSGSHISHLNGAGERLALQDGSVYDLSASSATMDSLLPAGQPVTALGGYYTAFADGTIYQESTLMTGIPTTPTAALLSDDSVTASTGGGSIGGGGGFSSTGSGVAGSRVSTAGIGLPTVKKYLTGGYVALSDGSLYSLVVKTVGSPKATAITGLPAGADIVYLGAKVLDENGDGSSIVLGGSVVLSDGTHCSLQTELATSCVGPPGTQLTPHLDVSKGIEGDDSITVNLSNGAYPSKTIVVQAFNTGDDPLTGITFADQTTSGDAVTGWTWTYNGQSNRPVSELADVTISPGDILVLRGTLTLTSTTTHKDTATVTATGSTSGVRVSDSDPYTVVPQQPTTSIVVAAGASGSDSITVPTQNDAYVQQGVTATAKNTGTEPLTSLAFTDTTNSGDAITGWTWTYGSQANRPISELSGLSLPPGQTVTFGGTLKISGTSTHKNTVTVSAAGSLSAKQVTGSDPFTAVPLATLTWSGADGGGHLLAGTEWTLKPSGGQAQTVTDNIGQSGYSGLDQDTTAGKFKVANLAQGSYTLAQTKTPAGFITAASRGVTLNRGGTTGVGSVSNQQISAITLPNAGSSQSSLLTALALTASLGACVLTLRARARHSFPPTHK
jgi:hypothetical protein